MSFLHWFLLRLPPETAHSVGKTVLRLLQFVWFRLLRRKFEARVSIVVPRLDPLRFPSRVGIAAGLDKDAEFFAGLALFGVGFAEVGTVTPLPQAGNPKPRLWRTSPGTLVNHMGFNSVGLDAFRAHLLRYRQTVRTLPLFANIGKNKQTPIESAIDDYRACFRALSGCVDGFVVNLSSPNTPGLTSLQSESFVSQLAELAPEGVPVFVKLSPDLPNSELEKLGTLVRGERKLAGVVLTNTSRELAQEVFDREVGGLSGRPLFSRALECVSVMRAAVGPDKVVIGVGGIHNRAAAQQMRRAGADLVEVYTGLVYRGASLLRELAQID